MKIQKALAAISFITVYRIVSIFGIILFLGIITHSICFKPDTPAKLFVIFLTVLGLFVIVPLLFVANSFKQQDEKTTTSQKEDITK